MLRLCENLAPSEAGWTLGADLHQGAEVPRDAALHRSGDVLGDGLRRPGDRDGALHRRPPWGHADEAMGEWPKKSRRLRGVCMHTCTRANINVHMQHMCMHMLNIHLHICTCAYMRVHISARVHACVCLYVFIQTHMCVLYVDGNGYI